MSVGTSFDDFLEEEGLLETTTLEAQKRILAWQIAQEMEKQHITRTELARRMETSRSSLNRILDPEHPSITLATMYKVAKSLGKHLELKLV
ncbi:MAG: XRE family transcriptional regulator [Deltaproteobacteria bacterium]|nr:XRE family transcriptional regulator [Deltaproteobacteria bacterium]